MQNRQAGILGQVKEGMEVYDNAGEQVGTVNFVRIGEEDPTNIEVEAATGDPRTPPQNKILEEVARVLGKMDNIPDEIKERMWRYGYVRIDMGTLHSDRIALHTEVDRVADNRVRLSVNQDELHKL